RCHGGKTGKCGNARQRPCERTGINGPTASDCLAVEMAANGRHGKDRCRSDYMPARSYKQVVSMRNSRKAGHHKVSYANPSERPESTHANIVIHLKQIVVSIL